ncbi:MAG: hypothetical protein Q7T08_04920 [Devosia sp.]|nr:hypothetical protein [Devosia sp.]
MAKTVTTIDCTAVRSSGFPSKTPLKIVLRFSRVMQHFRRKRPVNLNLLCGGVNRFVLSVSAPNAASKLPLAGHTFKQTALLRPDGMWELQPDPEVTQRIDTRRLAGEFDDDVVARLILAATGRRSVVSATREPSPRYDLARRTVRQTPPRWSRLARDESLATAAGLGIVRLAPRWSPPVPND